MRGFLPGAGLWCRPYMACLIPALPSRPIVSSYSASPTWTCLPFPSFKACSFFFKTLYLFIMMLPVNHQEYNSTLIFELWRFSRLGVVIWKKMALQGRGIIRRRGTAGVGVVFWEEVSRCGGGPWGLGDMVRQLQIIIELANTWMRICSVPGE